MRNLSLNLSVLIGLCLLILACSYPLIAFNMYYPEQPLLYNANANIHSLADLWQIYLHPQLLQYAVPFFRPSGHFLIYQLLTPFLGWHNNQAFIISNLLFLGLTSFLILKIYPQLFPGRYLGAWVAVAFYCMHPALCLSRMISLHFEFAYVFFALFSIYCCLRFLSQAARTEHYGWLALSIVSYILAVTFKEPAVALGPILFALVGLNANTLQMPRKQRIQVLTLLSFVTITLLIYLTLPWATLVHPLRHEYSLANAFRALTELIRLFVLSPVTWLDQAALPNATAIWRGVAMPGLASMYVITILSAVIFVLFTPKTKIEKKSCYFLSFAALINLVLPVMWGMAMPWHLNLTLLFFAFMAGFAIERCFKTRALTLSFALVGFGLAYVVNVENIKLYHNNPEFNLAMRVNANALQFAKKNALKINANSIIVIFDDKLKSPYWFGDSLYPYYFVNDMNFDDLELVQKNNVLKFSPLYNGSLFSWSFRIPSLREEIVPGAIADMKQFPQPIIYNWLQQKEQIVALTYDESGVWHDVSGKFLSALQEVAKAKPGTVFSYQETYAQAIKATPLQAVQIPYDDASLCQALCDQDSRCHAATYIHFVYANKIIRQCQLFANQNAPIEFCPVCTSYRKVTRIN